MPQQNIDTNQEKFSKILSEYEVILAEKDYIVLDHLTLADFSLLYMLIVSSIVGDFLGEYPNISRYYHKLIETLGAKEEEQEYH